ncbi:MAG: AsmA family protein [Planctomycetota bacterium]|jgi:hypothetical protein
MKAVKNIVLSVVLVIVVILVLAVVGFSIFGEKAIKAGIETVATNILKVGVTLEKIDLGLLQGKVEIADLKVNNPPGYAHEKLLELGTGKVQVSIGSLLSDTVKIKEIKLDGINLAIEQKGLSNNLKDVINSLPKADEKSKEEAEEGKNVEIEELEISNVKVLAKLLPVGGKETTIPLKLPTIRMSNIGGKDEKVSTGELVKKIMVAITEKITEAGRGILPDDMLKSMGDALNNVRDIGRAALEESQKVLKEGLKTGKDLGESAKDVGEEIKDTGKNVVEGFKGLLKPKKKE